jgi:hypothetical protein
MQLRYRSSLFGKLILQVVRETKKGLVWVDADIQDFQEIVKESMEGIDEEETEPDKLVGFGV